MTKGWKQRKHVRSNRKKAWKAGRGKYVSPNKDLGYRKWLKEEKGIEFGLLWGLGTRGANASYRREYNKTKKLESHKFIPALMRPELCALCWKTKEWHKSLPHPHLSKRKRLWRSNYLQAKRMGYLNVPDLWEAYALGVISKQEYVKQLKKINNG